MLHKGFYSLLAQERRNRCRSEKQTTRFDYQTPSQHRPPVMIRVERESSFCIIIWFPKQQIIIIPMQDEEFTTLRK
jgi:hypothetical protein